MLPEYIPLEEVPKLDCLRRVRSKRGRKHSKSQVRRWWTDGINGVHLKTHKIGGIRCSTEQDLQEFFEESGMAERITPQTQPNPRRCTTRQERAKSAVQKKLYGAIALALSISPIQGDPNVEMPLTPKHHICASMLQATAYSCSTDVRLRLNNARTGELIFRPTGLVDLNVRDNDFY